MAKPKVALYWAAGCGGCDVAVLDTNEKILDIAGLVDIVFWPIALDFKYHHVEAMPDGDIDLCLFNGSIRNSEHEKVAKLLRAKSKVMVAFGACACIGGVNCLKNHLTMDEALQIVYGDAAKYYDTMPARPVNAVVKVDYYVRGCPPVQAELVKVIKALLMGKKPEIPNYPVCVECKMAGNICVFERGKTCLGPVARAGCSAICVTAGRHCWGCRGLVDEPNIASEKEVLQKYGLTVEQALDKFKIYNSYAEVAK